MASFKSERKPYARPQIQERWLHDKAPTGPRKGRIFGNGAPFDPPTGPAYSNSKLIVANLHYEITPANLSAIFGQIGVLAYEPQIRYDRSGRSSGTAIITFENSEDAGMAKKSFDGILAKGQPMSVTFDTSAPKKVQRMTRAPTSLLDRVQTSLLDRLSDGNTVGKIKPHPSGPRNRNSKTTDIIRNRPSFRSHDSKKPETTLTVEYLDNELDAFMKDAEPSSATCVPISAGPIDASSVAVVADVDMD